MTRSRDVVDTLLEDCELLMNSFRSGERTRLATVTRLDWVYGRPVAALVQEHDDLGKTLNELSGQIRAARRALRINWQFLSATNPLRGSEDRSTLWTCEEVATTYRTLFDDPEDVDMDVEEGGVSI
ncbi:hypothetical protein LTR95_002181 [Oleoguttula sp. CCFEE 5521]